MEVLYVLSKDMGDGPRLIGKLYKLGDGKYQFTYCLGKRKAFPEWFLQIDEFEDIQKVYETEDVLTFINRFVPAENSRWVHHIMKSLGVQKYDKWELLKRMNYNPFDDVYFVETLPRGVKTYE